MSDQVGLEELPTELSYERKVGGGERERRQFIITAVGQALYLQYLYSSKDSRNISGNLIALRKK